LFLYRETRSITRRQLSLRLNTELPTEHKTTLENIARVISMYCCHADYKDHLSSKEIILYDKADEAWQESSCIAPRCYESFLSD